MSRALLHNLLILLCTLSFIIRCLSLHPENMVNSNILIVGKELWKEKLPLQMGSRIYQLQGLKPYTSYEVKISYPASIPASFSIQMTSHNSDLELNLRRKLLNTEKLIFKTDSPDLLSDQGGMHVLVTVEPEGVVAIPHGREREFIIFNIVCDELVFGIPQEAWWVVVLVCFCLVVASIIPRFLPSHLLARNQSRRPVIQNASKHS